MIRIFRDSVHKSKACHLSSSINCHLWCGQLSCAGWHVDDGSTFPKCEQGKVFRQEKTLWTILRLNRRSLTQALQTAANSKLMVGQQPLTNARFQCIQVVTISISFSYFNLQISIYLLLNLPNIQVFTEVCPLNVWPWPYKPFYSLWKQWSRVSKKVQLIHECLQ